MWLRSIKCGLGVSNVANMGRGRGSIAGLRLFLGFRKSLIWGMPSLRKFVCWPRQLIGAGLTPSLVPLEKGVRL